MVTEDGEILGGWPLGLEVMNTRLRMAEHENLPTRTVAPFSLHLPSMSFSSFSSSELDTVSTASFFQDRSVSLGRLIGIRPTDKRWLYLPRATSDLIDKNERISVNTARLDVSKETTAERICIPLLIGIILKIVRSRRNSRRQIIQ